MELIARQWASDGRTTALFDIMESNGRTRLTSGVWARALAAHDPVAIELINGAVTALGAAIGSAVNLLDVAGVVVGGGLAVRLGDVFAARIREAAIPHMVRPEDPPQFRLASLGDLGGAIGAAMLFDAVA